MNSAFDQLFDDPGEPQISKLDATGAIVASYQIERLLADQTASQVYLAKDVQLDRPAALKVLKQSHSQGADVSSRFRLEGRILAKLRHPNIVQLYGVHELEKLPCLAMEFIDGGSLADVVRRNPLPVDTAVLVLLRVSRAVAAAHRLGIIHRDLKPQNILIDSSIIEPALDTPIGFIKVADFGIARMLDGFESLTLTGMQPGTALYMAPEQVEARSRDICFATDVFSLGAILFAMLTGASPFNSASVADSLQKIVREAPPILSEHCKNVPPWLDTIFTRCMNKDASLRFRDAEELADEISARVRSAIETRHQRPMTQLILVSAIVFIVAALIYRFVVR